MEWLIYLLKVSACTGLFYAFYHLFLRKLTFFNSNRFYLLSTLILSLTIPALQIYIEVPVLETTQVISSPDYVDGATGLAIPKENYLMINAKETVSREFDWDAILLMVYVTISVLMLFNFLFQLISLLFYTRNVIERIGQLRIVFKPFGFTSCSFFNYVFIDQKDLLGRDMQVFLQHERVHATEYHSVDKMLTALFKVLLWFNPFIYLYGQELSQLHEYEADRSTSQSIGSQCYAELLLEKAAEKKTHSFIHSFAVKPLKGRIIMLFSNQSKNMKKLRYFAALPIIGTLLLGFSVEYLPAVVGVNKPVQDSTVFRQRIKRTPDMIKGKKAFEEWRKTNDYKDRVRAMELVAGKTLTGVVNINPEPLDRKLKNSMLFVSNNVTYYLFLADSPEKIQGLLKPNSIVTVNVNTPMISKEGKYMELRAASLRINGKEVYRMKASIAPPFLYEVNKVRFADGIIKKVSTIYNGEKEFNISANGYTFILRVDNKQVSLSELDEIKAGDDVRFRFVHEVKKGNKTYLIKDWVSLSTDIRSYGIKNKLIFTTFYEPVALNKAESSEMKSQVDNDKMEFSDKIEFTAKGYAQVSKGGNVMSFYGGATITFQDVRISGDEITFDHQSKIGVAKAAVLERNGVKSGPSDSIAFNLNTKKYNLYGIK